MPPYRDRYRWVILVIVGVANGIVAAFVLGIPALGPAIRESFDLTLPQLGIVLASTEGGLSLTPLIWGKLADVIGERAVISAGLAGGAIMLVGAASTDGLATLVIALGGCGALIGAASTASGSAVMGWFGRHQRGFALGIRQMAVPLGGALAALSLPLIAAEGGVDAALLALAGLAGGAAVIAAVFVREPPDTGPLPGAVPPGERRLPLRDSRVWRISIGGSVIVCAQAALLGFIVIFLHDERGLSVRNAAGVLAAIQVGAAIARLVAGRRSDMIGRRVAPQRTLAWTAAAGFALAAALVEAPLVLLIPVFVITGVLVMSGGGLAIASTAEIAGRERAGTAIGLFQTFARALSACAGASFGALVAATSWSVGFAMLAALSLIGWWTLRELVADEEDRILARDRRLAAAEATPGP